MARKLGLAGRALVGAISGAAEANLERFEEEGRLKRERALVDYRQKYRLELQAIISSNALAAAKLREQGTTGRFEATAEATQGRFEAREKGVQDRFEATAEATQGRFDATQGRFEATAKAAANKPLSPAADLQADVDAGRITQEVMDGVLKQKPKGQTMADYNRVLSAVKKFTDADPRVFRLNKDGSQFFDNFTGLSRIDPAKYGMVFKENLAKFNSGELGPPKAPTASAEVPTLPPPDAQSLSRQTSDTVLPPIGDIGEQPSAVLPGIPTAAPGALLRGRLTPPPGASRPTRPGRGPRTTGPTGRPTAGQPQGYEPTGMKATRPNGDTLPDEFEVTTENGEVWQVYQGEWWKRR